VSFAFLSDLEGNAPLQVVRVIEGSYMCKHLDLVAKQLSMKLTLRFRNSGPRLNVARILKLAPTVPGRTRPKS